MLNAEIFISSAPWKHYVVLGKSIDVSTEWHVLAHTTTPDLPDHKIKEYLSIGNRIGREMYCSIKIVLVAREWVPEVRSRGWLTDGTGVVCINK
jgi:hypothetical protein